jgi:hypothetical protein
MNGLDSTEVIGEDPVSMLRQLATDKTHTFHKMKLIKVKKDIWIYKKGIRLG